MKKDAGIAIRKIWMEKSNHADPVISLINGKGMKPKMVKHLPYGTLKNGLLKHWECICCGKQYSQWISSIRHENKCLKNLKIPKWFFNVDGVKENEKRKNE